MLGAQGVQMGTAFLTSHESGANELLKDTILKVKRLIQWSLMYLVAKMLVVLITNSLKK